MTNLDKLRNLTKTQSSPGNGDYDPYMHGMANGMILALAIMEDKEPQFLNAPEVWGRDKKVMGAPTEASSS